MTPRSRTARRLALPRAPRTCWRRCWPSCSLAFIVQIVFRYLLNFPIGWTNELSVITVALAGAVGRRLRRPRGARRSASTSSTARVGRAHAARHGRSSPRVALVVLYAISLPAVVDYVTFMKVRRPPISKIRFDWLFSIYVVFAVAVDRPLSLARLAGAAGRRRRKRSTRPRRAPAYELRQPVLALDRRDHRRWRSSACRSATR